MPEEDCATHNGRAKDRTSPETSMCPRAIVQFNWLITM